MYSAVSGEHRKSTAIEHYEKKRDVLSRRHRRVLPRIFPRACECILRRRVLVSEAAAVSMMAAAARANADLSISISHGFLSTLVLSLFSSPLYIASSTSSSSSISLASC